LAEIFDIEPYKLFQEKDTFNLAKISGIRLELLQKLEESDDETTDVLLNLIKKMMKK